MKTINIKKAQYVPPGSYVEGGDIQARYPLADLAVTLVRQFDDNALTFVGKIKDLPGGPFGSYSTGENVHNMSEEIAQKVRLVFNTENIHLIPKVSLIKAIPELNEQSIQIGDTIRVNINKILREAQHPNPLQFHFNVVSEVAKTIYHEAVHARETEETGTTSEPSAEGAEAKLGEYLNSNYDTIIEQIKQKSGLSDEEISRYEQQSIQQ